MTNSLVISDYYSLLALHRAIIEAKFSEAGTNSELLGSPILAKTAQDIVELLVLKEIELGMQDNHDTWNKWRELDTTRREWNITVNYIVNHINIWKNWTEQQKKEFIKVVISPYTISPELLNFTIDKINNTNT